MNQQLMQNDIKDHQHKLSFQIRKMYDNYVRGTRWRENYLSEIKLIVFSDFFFLYLLSSTAVTDYNNNVIMIGDKMPPGQFDVN